MALVAAHCHNCGRIIILSDDFQNLCLCGNELYSATRYRLMIDDSTTKQKDSEMNGEK